MATKNISITEEAYKRLANLRKGNESFSEIIIKVTKRGDWRRYFGILSEEKADILEKSISFGRKKHMELHIARSKEIAKEFK
jgi:predicted CopG family antitoxin